MSCAVCNILPAVFF